MRANKQYKCTSLTLSYQVLDYLAIGIHEIANMSERRLERLVHPGRWFKRYSELVHMMCM